MSILDSTIHCTMFALSEPNCAEHYSKCSQAHRISYLHCMNIIQTLDDIKQKLEKSPTRIFEPKSNITVKMGLSILLNVLVIIYLLLTRKHLPTVGHFLTSYFGYE